MDKTICESCGEWVDCMEDGSPYQHTCAPEGLRVTDQFRQAFIGALRRGDALWAARLSAATKKGREG
jgi:hypothetical protein